AIFDPDMVWVFGAWAEHRTQWETEDAPSGVDRQVLCAGIRLAGRLVRQPKRSHDEPLEEDAWLDEPPPSRAHRRYNGRNDEARKDIVRTPTPPDGAPLPAPDDETHEAVNEENTLDIEEIRGAPDEDAAP
ncbi:MAG: hypothetical protein JRI25_27170, partial [Deltaproteobacteria bacterium]|nr:hypothetical protein [Deltaproteobacteria bacterium]